MTVVPMPKKGKAASSAVEKPYEPTEREIAAQAAYNKRRRSKPPVPKERSR